MIEQQRCSQEGCEVIAAMSYVWPGRPERVFACQEHYDMAIDIAGGMGWTIGDPQPVEFVEVPDPAAPTSTLRGKAKIGLRVKGADGELK